MQVCYGLQYMVVLHLALIHICTPLCVHNEMLNPDSPNTQALVELGMYVCVV